MGRRRQKIANPLQVNVPGPKPQRGKENTPKRTVPAQQGQRKTVKVARRGREPLQRVDGNLAGTEEHGVHVQEGAESLSQRSVSAKVAATSIRTQRERAAPSRHVQHISTASVSTERGVPNTIEDLTSDFEDFSINDQDMEFEQPPLTTLADSTPMNPHPTSSKTSDCRHPSEVPSSTQQPSISASQSYNPQTPIVSHLNIDKDNKSGKVQANTISQTPAAHLKAPKDIAKQGPLAADQKRANSADEHVSEERVNNLSNMVSDMSLEDANPVNTAVIPGTHSWTSTFEVSSFMPPLASTPYHNTRPRHTGSIAKGYSKPMQPRDLHKMAGNDKEITALHSQACSSMNETVFAPETPARLWDLCGGTRLRPETVRDNETWVVGDSFS